MARCGRCGLWAKTSPEAKEKKWAGTCLWFQTKLESEFEYDERECEEFIDKIPQYDAAWHFDYKCKRDNLGDVYEAANRNKKRAILAIVISIASLTFNIIKEILL